jgi:hypothetical protein
LITSAFKSIEDVDSSNSFVFGTKLKVLGWVSAKFRHKPYVVPEDKMKGIAASQAPYLLPARIRKEIGADSVDVMPHMISMVYFNGLNYSPRPGVQTYAAYDKFLDSIDANKFRGPSAPAFVIYCGEHRDFDASIDDRYPFFDEPMTKIALLQNYEVVDSFSNQLLLKKRRAGDGEKLNYLSENFIETTLNKEVAVPLSNDLVFANLTINYSAWGKMRRVMYQPPSLRVEFMLEDSSRHNFKIIKPLMGSDVLINRYIVSNNAFSSLMKSDYRQVPRIVSFKVVGDLSGFAPLVGVNFKSFRNTPVYRLAKLRDPKGLR